MKCEGCESEDVKSLGSKCYHFIEEFKYECNTCGLRFTVRVLAK